MRRREPLETARLVDDPLEQPRHRPVVERSTIARAHVGQHLGFARRLIDRLAREFLPLSSATNC